MTHAIGSRRALVAALILTAMLSFLPFSRASAVLTVDQDGYTYVSKKICPIDWRQGTYQVKQLIRCAAAYYGISVERALYIAKRESNFQPDAYNSWSCAKGIFQHLCKYWPDRAYSYGFKGWSAFNARANIIVTMRMVRRYGWSPWS
jgi:hypothetical protein